MHRRYCGKYCRFLDSSDSRLIQCGGKDCPLADLSKVRRWQLGEWRDVVTISKCGRKSDCLKRTSLQGWPWFGWHRHQLLHKSRYLLFTFTFYFRNHNMKSLGDYFSLLPSTCTQSLYERSVSFSALGTPHSGEEKITEMAKSSDNFAPYVHFQDQPRSTASLLKEYLTPLQVCLHIWDF